MSRRQTRLEPTLDFLQHLWRLNHAMERTSALMEEHLGVTAQQRLLLRVLSRTPGATSAELADILHVDPATVSVSIKRLEARGLLKRRRLAADRRRVGLQLTAAGRRLARPAALSIETAVASTLRREGRRKGQIARRVLSGLAETLAKNFEAPRRRRPPASSTHSS
jgi:DNA-binding MarR family transcriptional regulator